MLELMIVIMLGEETETYHTVVESCPTAKEVQRFKADIKEDVAIYMTCDKKVIILI